VKAKGLKQKAESGKEQVEAKGEGEEERPSRQQPVSLELVNL
jgi:hypothetical protein